jgi:hypothetical protein
MLKIVMLVPCIIIAAISVAAHTVASFFKLIGDLSYEAFLFLDDIRVDDDR